MTSPICERHKHLDPAAEWLTADSVDHFVHCITNEQRVQRWEHMAKAASAGFRCWEFDHDGQLARKAGGLEHARQQNPIPPVDEPVPDMHVTVEWPGDRGQMQGVTYDRNGGPVVDTLTPLDRRIIRALLEHALSQVPTVPNPKATELWQGFHRQAGAL